MNFILSRHFTSFYVNKDQDGSKILKRKMVITDFVVTILYKCWESDDYDRSGEFILHGAAGL